MSWATKMVKKSDSKTEVRYIVNDNDERTEVVLPIELYEALLDEVEELQDIKDFDEAPDKRSEASRKQENEESRRVAHSGWRLSCDLWCQ